VAQVVKKKYVRGAFNIVVTQVFTKKLRAQKYVKGRPYII